MARFQFVVLGLLLTGCVGRVHVDQEHAAEAPAKAQEACQRFGWSKAVPSKECSAGSTCLEEVARG